jgi:hypothetical protein
MFGRYDEHVRGRLRVEIVERHDVLVAQHFVRLDLLAHDHAEDAL